MLKNRFQSFSGLVSIHTHTMASVLASAAQAANKITSISSINNNVHTIVNCIISASKQGQSKFTYSAKWQAVDADDNTFDERRENVRNKIIQVVMVYFPEIKTTFEELPEEDNKWTLQIKFSW